MSGNDQLRGGARLKNAFPESDEEMSHNTNAILDPLRCLPVSRDSSA